MKAECLPLARQWRPSKSHVPKQVRLQGWICGQRLFQMTWFGCLRMLPKTCLSWKAKNPWWTDTFRTLKRMKGIRWGMQEDDLNKNGRFFFTLHLCHVFLTGKITRQVKTLDRCWIKPSQTKKGFTAFSYKSLILLVGRVGIEPTTYWLRVSCSAWLS